MMVRSYWLEFDNQPFVSVTSKFVVIGSKFLLIHKTVQSTVKRYNLSTVDNSLSWFFVHFFIFMNILKHLNKIDINSFTMTIYEQLQLDV